MVLVVVEDVNFCSDNYNGTWKNILGNTEVMKWSYEIFRFLFSEREDSIFIYYFFAASLFLFFAIYANKKAAKNSGDYPN